MKKLLLALTLAITTTYAATTGSITLTGTVAQVLAIVVSPNPVATALNLTATQTDLIVGTVTESSNSATGYKILASSTNSLSLKRTGGTETLAYTFKYGTTSYVLTNTPITVKTVPTAGVYNNSSDLKISYTGIPAASMVEGSYTDTINLTIQAN